LANSYKDDRKSLDGQNQSLKKQLEDLKQTNIDLSKTITEHMNRVGQEEPDFERDNSGQMDGSFKLDEYKLTKIQKIKDLIDTKLVMIQTGEKPLLDS
jgi:hypothetical protein